MNRATGLVRAATAAPRRTVGASVRQMGGGGHSQPHPTEGFEGMVRRIFPEDHQLVAGVLGMYAGIILIAKMWPSSKKEEPAAAPAGPSTGISDVPSMFDEGFDKWLAVPGNAARWEKSVEEWANRK